MTELLDVVIKTKQRGMRVNGDVVFAFGT